MFTQWRRKKTEPLQSKNGSIPRAPDPKKTGAGSRGLRPRPRGCGPQIGIYALGFPAKSPPGRGEHRSATRDVRSLHRDGHEVRPLEGQEMERAAEALDEFTNR